MMRRHWLKGVAAAGLAAAAMLLTPAEGDAQFRGGRGGGVRIGVGGPGGWGGGPGVYRGGPGVNRGGWGGAYVGPRVGAYGGPWGGAYGGPRVGYYGGPWVSGYQVYSTPSYTYYPGTAYYSDSTYYSEPSVAYSASPTYVAPSSYSASPTYVAPSGYQSSYPPAEASQPAGNSANVEVMVPANAELWFDGHHTTQTGTRRTFYTPPLNAGTNSSYQVKATWMGPDGREVTQTRRVYVRPNESARVDFTQPQAGQLDRDERSEPRDRKEDLGNPPAREPRDIRDNRDPADLKRPGVRPNPADTRPNPADPNRPGTRPNPADLDTPAPRPNPADVPPRNPAEPRDQRDRREPRDQ